jgi:hypothetical protein
LSIEDTNKVDAIGLEVASGKVILTITDHLDWEDEHKHFLALQDKVNAYIRFVESGELLATYPKATDRRPVIDVVTRFELPQSALLFLDRIRPVLRSAGIELRTRVMPD